MKAFPIPVVALGPGTQTEDESLDYLPMPKDMDTYRAPMLPEPEEIAGRAAARGALVQVLALLDTAADGAAGGQVSLVMVIRHLGDRALFPHPPVAEL